MMFRSTAHLIAGGMPTGERAGDIMKNLLLTIG
jgi:hypothetical protein